MDPDLRWSYFDFESEEPAVPDDVTTILHMACGANSKNYMPKFELSRTRQMLNYAKRNKIRIIYLSSQSAHASKPSGTQKVKGIESLVYKKTVKLLGQVLYLVAGKQVCMDFFGNNRYAAGYSQIYAKPEHRYY